jgi:hypothetical protein
MTGMPVAVPMKPFIFISHSCKDNEAAPPAELSVEQAAARSARLRFARVLRDEVNRRLNATGRFDVFLDVRGGLNPGDIWQNGLHKALGHCAGAVILLSPEALDSGWVLKEATILSWRVFMGDALKVVPVGLGVSQAELVEKGFGAVNLDAIQWVNVPDATDAYRIDAVNKIVAAIEAIPASALGQAGWANKAEQWIAEFALLLRGAVPQGLEARYLPEMRRAVSIADDTEGRFDTNPFLNIAAQVLTANPNQVLKLLNGAGTPAKAGREAMQEKVGPLWVNLGAALPFATRSERVVAIDTGSTAFAQDYIRRAHFTRVAADRVLVPSDVNDGVFAGIMENIKRYLKGYLPIDNATDLDNDIQDNGAAYVVLGPGLARPDVLDELTRSYPQLTLVALTGPNWRARLGAWADRVLLLRPLLQPDEEQRGLRYRNRLQAFVTQQT